MCEEALTAFLMEIVSPETTNVVVIQHVNWPCSLVSTQCSWQWLQLVLSHVCVTTLCTLVLASLCDTCVHLEREVVLPHVTVSILMIIEGSGFTS